MLLMHIHHVCPFCHVFFFFFFSSRRRHTRCSRDWSSDVCSSDLPGIHHVFARTIKDLVCRYHTMLGQGVTRIAGWDTHGLPVEIEVERMLGISGKKQIEAYGIEKFNRLCRENVFKYKDD